jgi:hemoglobin/transferrin/lactoferrin receptor protein
VPEYAYSGEAGLEKVIQTRARLRVGVYTTLLDRAMVRRPFELNGQDSIVFAGEPSRVEAIVNASQAWVVGSYIAMDVNLGRDLKADLRYNWQRGMEQDDVLDHDVPLRHAPPPFGQAGIAWEREKMRIHAQVVFSDGFRFDQLPPTEQAKPALYAKDDQGRTHSPSWYVLDLRSSYRINKAFLFTLGIENITDQRYRPYSSGITAPGRNVVAALRYAFDQR